MMRQLLCSASAEPKTHAVTGVSPQLGGHLLVEAAKGKQHRSIDIALPRRVYKSQP